MSGPPSNLENRGTLELRGVCIVLAGKVLVPETSLTISPGEVVTIMGPSGSGKSSLLAFICGTLSPAFEVRGRTILDGHDITGHPVEKRQVGILFQDDLLFPHMSVGENLLFALPRSAGNRRERRNLMRKALEEAELTGYEDRDPATLSGGQRARVALMRTLLSRPKAILLDEPFSKLDADMRENIRNFVFRHVVERGVPTLMVTHDAADARAAGGRVVHIGNSSNGLVPVICRPDAA